MKRDLITLLAKKKGEKVLISGWVLQLRVLSKVTFIVVKDCSGTVQCVMATADKTIAIKLDDAIEIEGMVREEPRSKAGYEVDVLSLKVLNPCINNLPFNSFADLRQVGQETLLDYRPFTLRSHFTGSIFKVQARIVEKFREFLLKNYFTEIFSSKIVSGGTEGGANLFEIKYFERVAYLAQSPQFYKEECVLGFERVFETGHVYRAEPHATTRHLTEYYSLDLEMGFINGPEEIIQLEKELLSYIFDCLNQEFSELFKEFELQPLPSMLNVPTLEFKECLERLKKDFGRSDLIDDLDPEAEKQLCQLIEKETGVAALFVIGFPLKNRPFYTHPRGISGDAQSFDLLFNGLEITTGGQRLHKRDEIERVLTSRGMDKAAFTDHLRAFDIGMPPHGGLAIGLERLTAQILKLHNVRMATLYPRDKTHISP